MNGMISVRREGDVDVAREIDKARLDMERDEGVVRLYLWMGAEPPFEGELRVEDFDQWVEDDAPDGCEIRRAF